MRLVAASSRPFHFYVTAPRTSFADNSSLVANKFIQAVKDLDFEGVRSILAADSKWLEWHERDGKNSLHFLGGVRMVKPPGRKVTAKERAALSGPVKAATGTFAKKADTSLAILKLLLAKGMDINSIHKIPDNRCGYFPATPLWWAYTRGRNEKLYKYLLQKGADPRHCMYAITWYDDTPAAALFKKHGAFSSERLRPGKPEYFEDINGQSGMDSPLLAAFAWKKWHMAEWLLKNGADPDSTDERGATPLFHAVRKKYDPSQIRLLLNYGSDPDLRANDGRTPRSIAASFRDKTILQLLG